MGFRFRKSFKIAPGIKLNLGKKSAGISVGGKYGGLSFNSKSGARARATAYGTGLSYSTKIGGKRKVSKKTNTGTGGGCLLTCLKGMGILCLISFLLVFGWIAGLVWLIFFRKKLNSEPEKQKKQTIIVSVLSALSFIFLVYSLLSEPSSTKEEISASSMAIEESAPIVSTEEADKTSEEPATTTTKSGPAETPVATMTPPSETTPTNTPALTVEPTPTEAPTSSPAPAPETTVQPASGSNAVESTESEQIKSGDSAIMVWIDDTAKRYHKSNGCGMNNAYQVTLDEAKAKGKTACGRCYGK